MKKFFLPRGTADILPGVVSSWQNLEANARQILGLYGYQEIRTPLFEETELFSRSVGEASDIVQKQMLNLSSQKQADAGDIQSGLSLRPEGTASVVRAYLENNLASKEGLSKLYYIGPMFRGERPQKGRLRQFQQIGVEVLGPQARSVFLDAEVIALAVNLLKVFGIKDLSLKLNTLGTAEDKKAFAELLKTKLNKDFDAFCPDCQRRFEKNIFRILDCKQTNCQQVVRKLEIKREEYMSLESLAYFDQVKNLLSQLKIDFIESPYLVRGLDYYTQTVFEISCASLGSQDALGAGGRYDNLVQQLGGDKDVAYGALGFALGMERILLAAKDQAAAASQTVVFLVCLGDAARDKGFLLLQDIRQAGISADMSYQPDSIKSQMRQANKAGAPQVLILGDDELKAGEITLKDMQNSSQEKVALNHVIEVMQARLK